MSRIRNQHQTSNRSYLTNEVHAIAERSSPLSMQLRSRVAATPRPSLERWLEATKLQACSTLMERRKAAQTLANGRQSPPPPIVPKADASAAPSNDWVRVPADIYVEGAQVVMFFRICPFTGIVHEHRIDLVRLNS